MRVTFHGPESPSPATVARLTDAAPIGMRITVTRVVCAWCPDVPPTPGVSHGMCATCARAFERGAA